MLLINLYISVEVKECINLHTLLTTFKSINTVYLSPKQKRPKALTLSPFINGGPSVSRTQHQRIMSTDFFCGRDLVSQRFPILFSAPKLSPKQYLS
jgi:hypothetical protein